MAMWEIWAFATKNIKIQYMNIDQKPQTESQSASEIDVAEKAVRNAHVVVPIAAAVLIFVLAFIAINLAWMIVYLK